MRRRLLALALLMVACTPAFARSTEDRASFGSDVTVAEGETAGDIACAFCTVHVHGKVKGDIATFLGSVWIDSGRTVEGDVASLGGDLKLGQDASVDGDVAIAAGDLALGDGARIHGDRKVFPGRYWLLLPLAPFLILAGLIWLIVWIIRRNRYPYAVPPRRGF